jgi:hypothetical protein
MNQGGQIGRIFANWVIAYFGQFFENDKSCPNLLTLSPWQKWRINFGKNEFGYILGDIFRNSSGNPAWTTCLQLDFFHMEARQTN